ncbi:hypothetical protein HY032_03365, partial [Candidatus Gottesmanbacteria bacterium]|nr:hypothetical protein [Candidatus Gottesmanbacteria bacterium]
NTSSTDLAEYYVSGDDTIATGDVVTISNVKLHMTNEKGLVEEVVPKGVLRKATTPYDRNLIGVISTKPGVLMGSDDYDIAKGGKRMLALSGRVPVKIDPDSPAIAIGDFLTSSDKPGLARKATRPGYVVARALEEWKPCSSVIPDLIRDPAYTTLDSRVRGNDNCGVDRIEAFISLTYYVGDIDPNGRLVVKTFDTLTVTDSIVGSDKIRGNAPIDPDSQVVLVERVWGKVPSSVNVTPSYDTTTFVTDLTATGFTIHVGTPPKKKEELYWQAWW